MLTHDIIVMGGSMGAIEMFKDVLTQLPADLPASLFLVQHTAPHTEPLLADVLGPSSLLPVATADDRGPYAAGAVYVARPDQHLLIDAEAMHLSRGPRENGTRPAIDPLFRSAAVAMGSRVVGVVLSGMLDDGSAGLQAIKRCGGITVAQDPADAPYPDMPANAIRGGMVDHVVPVAKMGALLNRLARSRVAEERYTPPPELVVEARMARSLTDTMEINDQLGEPSHFTCPECGGTLWRIRDNAVERYRCHVGHAYSGLTLGAESDAAIDRALLASLRALEERARLYERLAHSQRQKGLEPLARSYRQEAERARENAGNIRSILLRR